VTEPVAILMPVRDDASRLARTLEAVRDHAAELGGVAVFLVDDGSEPPVDPASLPERTADFRVVLARHVVNLGQGAALETARQLALGHAGRFRAYVTMDADGQHRASDVRALVRAIEHGADVAFGNRFMGHSNVPAGRRALLFCARWFERALTGLRLADAHNGFRAFGRAALERVVIRQNRMAHATEIKLRVSRAPALRIVEVPVSVRYSRETLAKGQRATGAAAVASDLLLQYLFGDSP
jgi:glycosyltransferase involved in cell wall biosynthesis